jgi:hypothetical protein
VDVTDVEISVWVSVAKSRQSVSLPPEEVMAEMKAAGFILVNFAAVVST